MLCYSSHILIFYVFKLAAGFWAVQYMSIFSVTVEINNQFISPRLSDLCLLAASRVADILQRQMLHFGVWF